MGIDTLVWAVPLTLPDSVSMVGFAMKLLRMVLILVVGFLSFVNAFTKLHLFRDIIMGVRKPIKKRAKAHDVHEESSWKLTKVPHAKLILAVMP